MLWSRYCIIFTSKIRSLRLIMFESLAHDYTIFASRRAGIQIPVAWVKKKKSLSPSISMLLLPLNFPLNFSYYTLLFFVFKKKRSPELPENSNNFFETYCFVFQEVVYTKNHPWLYNLTKTMFSLSRDW